jgi:cytoskeleton protein RodZ
MNQDGASNMMHPVEGADHVGAFLREARETTGRTVLEVAENLRIRRVYLEAIEDGRFDELPGATYAVGFVRSYASYLRLDAPSLVARFKEEASGIAAPQELEFPTPVPEGRFPGGLLVTVCLLLGAAAFGGWYWFQSQNSIEVVRVPAPPADTQTNSVANVSPQPSASSAAPAAVAAGVVPAAAGAAAPAAPEAATVAAPDDTETLTMAAVPTISAPDDSAAIPDEPEVPLVPPSYLQPQGDPLASMVDIPLLDQTSAAVPPVADTPEAETPTVAPVAAPAAVTEVATASPPPAVFSSEPAIIALPEIAETDAPSSATAPDREGRTFGARNAAARIILRAEENTWVQVRDKDKNVVLTQMLQVGDRYLVPNRDGLRLMTGNAGGLDISVDGDTVPTIGERGESRRDVRLDVDLLKAGTAIVR